MSADPHPEQQRGEEVHDPRLFAACEAVRRGMTLARAARVGTTHVSSHPRRGGHTASCSTKPRSRTPARWISSEEG